MFLYVYTQEELEHRHFLLFTSTSLPRRKIQKYKSKDSGNFYYNIRALHMLLPQEIGAKLEKRKMYSQISEYKCTKYSLSWKYNFLLQSNVRSYQNTNIMYGKNIFPFAFHI